MEYVVKIKHPDGEKTYIFETKYPMSPEQLEYQIQKYLEAEGFTVKSSKLEWKE